MIARIAFSDGDKPAELVLDDDGVWRGAEPYASMANLDIRSASTTPAGEPYRRHVLELAATLGGTAEFPPREPGPPGRIY